jgi:hypothetical protein
VAERREGIRRQSAVATGEGARRWVRARRARLQRNGRKRQRCFDPFDRLRAGRAGVEDERADECRCEGKWLVCSGHPVRWAREDVWETLRQAQGDGRGEAAGGRRPGRSPCNSETTRRDTPKRHGASRPTIQGGSGRADGFGFDMNIGVVIVVIGAFFDIQGEAFGGRHATKRRRGGDVTRGGHAGACPPKTGQFTAIHSESLRGKALPYRGGGIGGRGHEKSKIAKRTQFGSSRRGKVGKAKPITKPNCGRRYDGAAFAPPASLWRVCRTRQRRLVGLGSSGQCRLRLRRTRLGG